MATPPVNPLQITTQERLRRLLPQLFNPLQSPGRLYLRCTIGENSALIEVTGIDECLLLEAERITPIPQMPPYVMGLMNSRQRVFFVIDLPQFFGFTPLPSSSRRYHILVTERTTSSHDSSFLGLAVNRIEGITRILLEELPQTSQTPQTPQTTATTYSQLPELYITSWQTCPLGKLPVLDIPRILEEVSKQF